MGGSEKTLGKAHPSTLGTVMNIANIYYYARNFVKAEELYERALKGFEAQLGKDHQDTKRCARNFRNCLKVSGNSERLAALISSYPGLAVKEWTKNVLVL